MYDNLGKSVTNSAFHHGPGKGFNIQNSNDVHLEGNVFFGLSQVGGRVKDSEKIVIVNNVIAHVDKRVVGKDFNNNDIVLYPSGGLLVCTDRNDKCEDIEVKGNVVAGTWNTGFGISGVQCSDT